MPPGRLYNEEIADVLRLVTTICFQYGLAFPKLEIPDVVFSQALASSDSFFSSEKNSLLFFSIVSTENKTLADVAAWQLFAGSYRQSSHPHNSWADVEERIAGNSLCLESAVYAVTKAKDPVVIAECLVAIVGRSCKASANLAGILEKMSVLSTSCQVFRDIETGLSQYDTAEHTQSSHFQLQMKMKAGISQLMLLIDAVPMLSAPRCIALTHAVCDVIVRGLTKHQPTRTSNTLLAVALEYLVALGPIWTSENPTRRCLCQSSVADGLVRVLGILGNKNRKHNRLVAVACSFFMLYANALPDEYFASRSKIIASDLLGEIRWNALLSSFPLTADIDNAVRIAKCCDLLKRIMTEELLEYIWAREGKSLTFTISLAAASCSVFAFTRQAALDVLMILMRNERVLPVWEWLAIRREIPFALSYGRNDSSSDILMKPDGDHV